MEKAKILIIDDDQDLRDSVQAILQNKQYNAITAADRDEGMQKIKSEKPDLIILDVMMATWQDGFDMARELKNDPQFKDMPILMLTGVQNESGINFKATAGDPSWCPVDGFLDKPVNPDVLLIEVEKILSNKSKTS